MDICFNASYTAAGLEQPLNGSDLNESILQERNLIRNLFRDFNFADVKKLGLELRVPLVTIELITSKEKTPQLQALEIVSYWRKNKPLDIQTEKFELANALKKCKHSRAAGRLLNKSATSYTDSAAEHDVYLKLAVIVTDRQARLFGHNLGLSNKAIKEIMQTRDYSDVKAHTMFVRWKRNCDLPERAIASEFDRALLAVITRNSNINSTDQYDMVSINEERATPIKSTKSTCIKCTGKKAILCCSMIIFILLVFAIFVIVAAHNIWDIVRFNSSNCTRKY